MRGLGMNILLAVSLGSEREAQLLILEHTPAGTEHQAPLILVGKGITFDTGGISIKPTENMWFMKDDMGGAAAVIGALESHRPSESATPGDWGCGLCGKHARRQSLSPRRHSDRHHG